MQVLGTWGPILKIVVVGCNAAGLNAAVASRKNSRDAEILMIESEPHLAYSRCGLPFLISGDIKSAQDLVVYGPGYYRMMGFQFRVNTTAIKLLHDRKQLVVEREGVSEVIPYDRLVLATGSEAFVPPIGGLDLPRVHGLRTLEDGMRLKEAVGRASVVVVIGGGLIGLEAAAATVSLGLRTTVVEMVDQIAPNMLDPDMAQLLRRRLEEAGMRIITGRPVQEIAEADDACHVITKDEKLQADLVVLAAGARPRTELARTAGLEIGVTGGIRVNDRLQTSVPDIYAAGECAEVTHFITGKPVLCQLGTTSVRAGKVAGTNASGGNKALSGVLCSSVSKLLETEVGSTGLTRRAAEHDGVRTLAGKVTGRTRAIYYPQGDELTTKLLFEQQTWRLVGGQIIGGEDVNQRINLLTMAILSGMTVHDLENLETCYTPPLSDTWEPSIHGASEAALAKLRRLN